MAKLLKLRRGTTSQHSSFTGAEGEVTVDTTKDTLVVHDGSTAGGKPLATEANLSAVNTDLVNDTTPQLGGHLDVNTKNITFGDSSDGATDDVLKFGAGTDLSIYSNGTHGVFQGDIEFNGEASDIFWDNSDNLLWFKTSSAGSQSAKAYFGDGPSYGNLEVSKTTSAGLVQTHNINLQLSTATSADININSGKDINFTNTTAVTNYYMRCKENSGSNQCVELYYGNTPTKRLETTATGVAVTGNLTATDLTLSGNLQVNGTTTTVASSTMTVADKNIELAKGAANDAAADGGGITLESGDGNKTITWTNATDTWDFNQNLKIINGENGSPCFYIVADEGDDNADTWKITHLASDNTLLFQNYTTGAYTTTLKLNPNGALEDSKGDVRKIPQNTQSSTYTLVAADAGKHILASGNVTIPNNVFAAGDAVTIINNTGSNKTLTASVGTLYNTADGSTGNRTLASRGMVTLLYASATVAYISGGGLS